MAAPGSEMPASELKTVSYRWPINTEMITMTELITMTAQVVCLPRKNSLAKGGQITNEAARADVDTNIVVAAWKADCTTVSKMVTTLMTHS